MQELYKINIDKLKQYKRDNLLNEKDLSKDLDVSVGTLNKIRKNKGLVSRILYKRFREKGLV